MMLARTVPGNQWIASQFHEHLKEVVEVEAKDLPVNMTPEEIRASYLLVWLAMAEPAGNA